MNSSTTQQYNMFLYVYTGCDQPVQRSYWPENAIDYIYCLLTKCFACFWGQNNLVLLDHSQLKRK